MVFCPRSKPVEEKEKEKTWLQVYTIFVVCINGLLGGLIFAWPSPSIPILLQETEFNMNQLSYFAIIPPIATVLASPFVGSLIDIFGRKYALLSIIISYSTSLILASVGGHLYIYYLSRVADGIGDACLFSCLPCYVSEICTPKVRSTWGNTVSLSMYFGQLVMNSIGSHFSIPHAAYIALALPVIFLLNFPVLPESPYWFVMKDRIEDARKSLQWLRGKITVEDELTQLIADVKRQQSETGRYVDLFLIESNRKSALIVMSVRWIQNFAGSAVFAVFIQTIFLRSGSNIAASTSSIIYNATCLSCSIVASSILDKLGTRLAMLLSCVGCCLVLLCQGTIFYINDETDLEFAGSAILPLVLMLFYVCVFSIGLGIVPTLLHGELFSSSIKSKAFVIMNINMGLSVASASQIFAVLLQYQGLYAIFFFYGCCTLLASIICYFIVPETKGKTLEEIQQQFKH